MSVPTVAIVEDNEKNRKIMRSLMTHHGYRTVEAVDGLAGLELVRRELPDVVLMDVQLPEMDGYSVTQALKQDASTKHIPIIAVTSFAMTGEVDRAEQAGCAAYISKPFDITELVETVQRLAPIE